MKRALVLGGGGAVGVAWETAILAGMLDGGIDVRAADLIVGTSAGSIVGTRLAGGRDPREMLREDATAERAPANNMPQDAASVTAAFQFWGSCEEMTAANCAAVGRVAMDAKTAPETQWVAQFAAQVDAWPDRPLLITAVDCESGAFRAFDCKQGVPIELAIAASCAVPGLFPTVAIEGRRYTDGGVRSSTSADLASTITPDVVLVLAPMAKGTTGVGALSTRQVELERVGLEAAGASVRVVRLDEATLLLAANSMDPGAAAAVVPNAEAHGRRLADELRAWWGE